METIFFNCRVWRWDETKQCYVPESKGHRRYMSKELMKKHLINKTARCLTQ